MSEKAHVLSNGDNTEYELNRDALEELVAIGLEV